MVSNDYWQFLDWLNEYQVAEINIISILKGDAMSINTFHSTIVQRK